MRAQRLGQPGKIVTGAAGAEHFVDRRDEDDVANAVGRQLETLAGVLARQRHIDALKLTQLGDGLAGIRIRWQIDRRERSESTVMPVSYTHLRAHETGRNLVCR